MCPGLIESLEDQLKAHVFLVAHRKSNQPSFRIFADVIGALKIVHLVCSQSVPWILCCMLSTPHAKSNPDFFHMFEYTGRIIRKERRGKTLYKQKVPLARLELSMLKYLQGLLHEE